MGYQIGCNCSETKLNDIDLDSVVTGEDSQDGQKSINFRILARLRINLNGKREQARRLRQSGSSAYLRKSKSSGIR